MSASNSDCAATALSPWEAAMIELFVRAAALIGLPRSIGELYGLLYCAPQPLSFDELMARLQLSKGSVSQGLKLLRQFGAVHVHYVSGSRKDHFFPELSIKRLIRGFFRDQFNPHLESGHQRLASLEEAVANESDPVLRAHAQQRLNTLRTWHARCQQLLPLLITVFGPAEDPGPRIVI